MNCDDATELLLEAEPEELAGQGESALALHIRECTRCAAAAAKALSATSAVGAQYRQLVPSLNGEQLANVTLAAANRALPIKSGRRTRVATWAVTSLAAAAVVAITVALRRPQPATVSPVAVAVADSSSVDVEVPDGRNAIVFRTRNPQISVVWIY